MRLFREELKATRHLISTLNDTICKLTSRIDSCEGRVSNLEDRLAVLENNRAVSDKTLLTMIEQLKADLNDREQDLLQNNIQISCVPQPNGENLTHTVITLAKKLGVDLLEQEIVSAVRVGRAAAAVPAIDGAPASVERPKLIVVRLARRAVKDQLLQAARVRRSTTTEGTGLPGPPVRFYVNERLTRISRLVFRRAREEARRLSWRYVWSRDGRVFARRDDNEPRHSLRSEADIDRVFSN
ncbi:hypothetical protein ACJJTC_018334 [Scirpophaga incertulas]